jgi:hypothetical protein
MLPKMQSASIILSTGDLKMNQDLKAIQGKMDIEIYEADSGKILTKERGFTVKEEAGKVLSFDAIERPDYGTVLLFGDQAYFVKFWDDEDLERALALTKEVFEGEIARRRNA